MKGGGAELSAPPPRAPPAHLFVNLCKLLQVVLKKGNLLLLGVQPPTVLGLQLCALHGGGAAMNPPPTTTPRDHNPPSVP